jgi:hypothetical protein
MATKPAIEGMGANRSNRLKKQCVMARYVELFDKRLKMLEIRLLHE